MNNAKFLRTPILKNAFDDYLNRNSVKFYALTLYLEIMFSPLLIHLLLLRKNCPYSELFSTNAGKCGPE